VFRGAFAVRPRSSAAVDSTCASRRAVSARVAGSRIAAGGSNEADGGHDVGLVDACPRATRHSDVVVARLASPSGSLYAHRALSRMAITHRVHGVHTRHARSAPSKGAHCMRAPQECTSAAFTTEWEDETNQAWMGAMGRSLVRALRTSARKAGGLRRLDGPCSRGGVWPEVVIIGSTWSRGVSAEDEIVPALLRGHAPGVSAGKCCKTSTNLYIRMRVDPPAVDHARV